MSAYAVKHFDLLNFVKHSKELGVSEPLAEYQGRQIEEAIGVAVETAIASTKEVVETKNLVTQQDLKLEQSNIELRIKEVEERITKVEERIKEVEASLILQIKDVEARLELKIEQAKNQVILWMGSFLLASGIITHFLK